MDFKVNLYNKNWSWFASPISSKLFVFLLKAFLIIKGSFHANYEELHKKLHNIIGCDVDAMIHGNDAVVCVN